MNVFAALKHRLGPVLGVAIACLSLLAIACDTGYLLGRTRTPVKDQEAPGTQSDGAAIGLDSGDDAPAQPVVSSDAGLDVAAADATVTGTKIFGRVELSQDSAKSGRVFTDFTRFFSKTMGTDPFALNRSGCAFAQYGDCELQTCTPIQPISNSAMRVLAPEVAFAGPSFPSGESRFRASLGDGPVFNVGQYFFGGQAVDVSGGGQGIEPFAVRIAKAPTDVNLMAPSCLRGDGPGGVPFWNCGRYKQGQALSVRWSPQGACALDFVVRANHPARGLSRIVCKFPAQTSTGDVPEAAITALLAGSNAKDLTLTASCSASEIFDSPTQNVRVELIQEIVDTATMPIEE